MQFCELVSLLHLCDDTIKQPVNNDGKIESSKHT
jgi:hypothetical protein